MSKYINIGNDGFCKARNDDYIDKSDLITYVNRSLNTEHNMLCLTRARRFGKSMAAKMLCAYYDCSCNSRFLFEDLRIAHDATFEEHLNQHNVIYLDVTCFTTTCRPISKIVQAMEQSLIEDLQSTYPDLPISNAKPLVESLLLVAQNRKRKFIMIIDEWDAICRESDNRPQIMREYVDWLRSLYKSAFTDRIFEGVYMTGILPIKQYNTQSALNNFREFTMVNPGPLAGYFGFTREEVNGLSVRYGVPEEDLHKWYDGYRMGDIDEIFNPFSVMAAVQNRKIASYWAQTDSYENLRQYISMNFDGLRDSVVALLAGESVKVNVLDFSNDIHEIKSRNAVLTLLIHLGYLSYDEDTQTACIPNFEVRCEFERTIDDGNWKYIAMALQNSETLLHDTLMCNAHAVEQAIDTIHQDNTSILQYNNENSLSCVLTLAYQAARKDYVFVRELPTGKGFADIVLVPKRNVDKPAIVLELKWNQSAYTAISQIKQKNYVGVLSQYVGQVVLVGINYNKSTKKHRCEIEKIHSPHTI